jgi:hypothetical protein
MATPPFEQSVKKTSDFKPFLLVKTHRIAMLDLSSSSLAPPEDFFLK